MNRTDKNNTHHLPAWTEVEYTASCKTPYLKDSFFIPKETKFFLCREDGTREEQRMIFLVFKPVGAPDDAEWEDDPTPGELWVRPLGDDDEEIEPAKVVYLGQDINDIVTVADENDQYITLNVYWRHGTTRMEKAEKTDAGFVCYKDYFGDDGLPITFIPDDGTAPFVLRLQIPYVGFSLYDYNGHKRHGSIKIYHDKVDGFTYDFVGDANTDRFTLELDNKKRVYLCVLRPEEHKLAIRDQRNRLALVDEISSEGKISELLMGAHSAVVKSRSHRWDISLEGTTLTEDSEIDITPAGVVSFAREQIEKGIDINLLGEQLIAMEKMYLFQWCWLHEDDWSQDNPMFDMFMKQLRAFSFVQQLPIQGDAIATRNNKRKIRRCARLLKAHERGELSLWDETEEQREEILNLFFHFHQAFVDAMDQIEDGEEEENE